MVAHACGQTAFIKMETQGEGNYASTVPTDTRDQETVHGLTLSPKIQSSDPWLFDAAGAFGDQDLDALLGPVQFDLIAEEARKNNLEIDALFNDEYQLPEPPAKKRKVTRELSKEPSAQSELIGPTCEQESYPILSDESNEAPKPLSPVFYNSTCSHSASVYTLPYINAASIRDSPYVHATSGGAIATSGSLHSVKPLGEVKGAVSVAESPSLLGEDWQRPLLENRDEGPGAQVFDDSADDGSLFGDYVSSKERSIECSPIAARSFEGEEDVKLRPTESSITPAMLWNPDVPIPSVERELSPTGHYHTFQIPQVSKRTSKKSLIGSGLFECNQNGTQASPNRSLQNLAGQAQNRASGLERHQSQTKRCSTLSSFPKSLSLSTAFALAAPVHRDSIELTIKRARALLTSDTSEHAALNSTAHEIPLQLKSLLDSLYTKFNKDKDFRTSSITWLVRKMDSLAGTKDANGGEPEQNFREELDASADLDTAKNLLEQERRDHAAVETDLRKHADLLLQGEIDLTNKYLALQTAYGRLEGERNILQLERDCYRDLIDRRLGSSQETCPITPVDATPQLQTRTITFPTRTPSSLTMDPSAEIVYNICQHPDSERAEGICGSYNMSKHTVSRQGRSANRKRCMTCRGSLDISRVITKEEFETAVKEGKAEKQSGRTGVKRKLVKSADIVSREPPQARIVSCQTPNFGSGLKTSSSVGAQAVDLSALVPTLDDRRPLIIDQK